MKQYRPIPFFFIIFLILSCARVSTLPPQYLYEEEAIRLRLKADPQLNQFQGTPHALVACIYQLTLPNVYNQMISEKEGLAKLLQCSHFDVSVASYQRLVIQPGEKITQLIDRAEGVRYVAIVAGYYSIEKEKITHLYEIPLISEKKGLFNPTIISKPGPLHISLYLGPEKMTEWEEP